MSGEWRECIRPIRLERRYEFADYASLRDFLDLAADVSEKEGLYPDMGFGRDYVNITIHKNENSDSLGETERRLAAQLDEIYEKKE